MRDVRSFSLSTLSALCSLGGRPPSALPAAAARRRPCVVAPVQFCEKMCPQDFAPCDPIYFKTADSRCAQVGVGR